MAGPPAADSRSRGGRKWDVRSYVLCTSVAPLRLYLFTEGIVRYASALYAADATDSTDVAATGLKLRLCEWPPCRLVQSISRDKVRLDVALWFHAIEWHGTLGRRRGGVIHVRRRLLLIQAWRHIWPGLRWKRLQ